MLKRRLLALLVFLIGVAIAFFVYWSETNHWKPFRLGLDLSGGTALTYRADVSGLQNQDVSESMASLRDTIERRVNAFGVSEPLVQTEVSSALSGTREQRLLVELPGITDTQKAIEFVGQTPQLEFRLLKEGREPLPAGQKVVAINDVYGPALLTGGHLKNAQLQFANGTGQISNQAQVLLHFNAEGTKVFSDTTTKNVGKIFGIFLDGVPITQPVIESAITDGTAVITGNFTPTEARELVRNLNFGALPVPIELISTETVGSTLGKSAVEKGILAGIVGFLAVALFMVIWYRLPGLVASVALLMYAASMLAIFMLLPVTLTAAGIAAFILSIGMAVDANVLIFERTREELEAGKSAHDAIHDGFLRAWLSIRDSNISSMITAIILFWLGTSLVKGFALVFGLGVLVSMLTAISVSRTFLYALGVERAGKTLRFLFGSGLPGRGSNA